MCLLVCHYGTYLLYSEFDVLLPHNHFFRVSKFLAGIVFRIHLSPIFTLFLFFMSGFYSATRHQPSKYSACELRRELNWVTTYVVEIFSACVFCSGLFFQHFFVFDFLWTYGFCGPSDVFVVNWHGPAHLIRATKCNASSRENGNLARASSLARWREPGP